MSGEPRAVKIADDVLAAVYAHARETFPAECCGWLAGARGGDATRIRKTANAYDPSAHPTASDRTAETAYVIGGADLVALSKELDGPEPPLVIYHSHPNGRAYFSDTDKAVATDPWGEGPTFPVQQLIVGVLADRVVEAAQFAWSEAANGFVEVARWQVK